MVIRPLASIAGPHIPPDKAIALLTSLNDWMVRLMPVAALVGVIIALGNGYRLFRIHSERTRGLMDSSGRHSPAFHAVSGRK